MSGWSRFAHLLALATLAIAVPVFVAVGPQYYIGHGADRVDPVLVALLVLLAPAAALFAGAWLVGLAGAGARSAAQASAVGVLACLLISGGIAQANAPPPVHGVLTVAGGVLGAAAYHLLPSLRHGLALMAPVLAVLALGGYLLQPRMLQLIVGGEATAATVHPAVVGRLSPVVLIVLDEMSGLTLMDRHGRLDAGRFPNFARLARDATWYPRATSGRSDTELAVPSVLTGRWAPHDALPTASRFPRSIFTMLGGTHAMHASEPWTDICPERLCPESSRRAAPARIADLLHNALLVLGHVIVPAADRVGIPRPRESGAPNRVKQIRDFAADLRPRARPGLHVLHVLLPHKPWRYLPSGAPYPNAVARDRWLAGFSQWGPDPWPVAQAEQRYLLQSAHVDRLLGLLLDRMQATGLYDEAMVIVAADHGVSFRAADRRRDATATNAQDILSVPLLMKPPGQRRGRVDRRLVRTVDIVPTIADQLGLRTGWEVDGRSLLRPVQRAGVWIENGDGSRINWDASTFVRRSKEAVRERVARFGDGHAPQSLWTYGPRSDLLGECVADVASTPLDASAHVVGLERLGDFRPGVPGLVPARIAGTMDGVAIGTPLAIALNGRVVATTQSYDGDRGIEFSAMIDPERALRRGSNRLDVLVIDDETLRPLSLGG